MDEGNSDAAVADGGCDALERAEPNVSASEYAGLDEGRGFPSSDAP
jgi:hypothetical protein